MTEEEKREQILKRALPALFITIIYFIFISDIMAEKAQKAEGDYTKLMQKGISPAALPNIYKQQSQAREKLSKLQAEQKKYATEIKSMAGFLSGEADSTDTARDLANILVKHQVSVAKEIGESFKVDDLPAALKEVRALLQSKDKKAKQAKTELIAVQHFWLQGGFNNMYAALAEMNQAKLSAIPVKMMMSVPSNSENGMLEWELLLWM